MKTDFVSLEAVVANGCLELLLMGNSQGKLAEATAGNDALERIFSPVLDNHRETLVKIPTERKYNWFF